MKGGGKGAREGMDYDGGRVDRRCTNVPLST